MLDPHASLGQLVFGPNTTLVGLVPRNESAQPGFGLRRGMGRGVGRGPVIEAYQRIGLRELVCGGGDQPDAIGIDLATAERDPRLRQKTADATCLGKPALNRASRLLDNQRELVGSERCLKFADHRIGRGLGLAASQIGKCQHLDGDLSLDAGRSNLEIGNPIEDHLTAVAHFVHTSKLAVTTDSRIGDETVEIWPRRGVFRMATAAADAHTSSRSGSASSDSWLIALQTVRLDCL